MVRRKSIFAKLVAAIALALALVVGQVAVAGTATAHGDDGHKHKVVKKHKIATTTDLKVWRKAACAYVTSERGTPTGTVKFTLTRKWPGHKTWSVTEPLKHGKACVGLNLRPGKYQLTAAYSGSHKHKPSSDTEYFKVWKHNDHKWDDHKDHKWDDHEHHKWDDHEHHKWDGHEHHKWDGHKEWDHSTW